MYHAMNDKTLLVSAAYVAVALLGAAGLVRLWTRPARRRNRDLRIRAGIDPKKINQRHAIKTNAEGFKVLEVQKWDLKTYEMRWADICRVVVLKRDRITVDDICMFFGRVDGTGLELNEDMTGWKELVEGLPQNLPGCKPVDEWCAAIEHPPFATNTTEIYERDKCSASLPSG